MKKKINKNFLLFLVIFLIYINKYKGYINITNNTCLSK